MALDGEFKKAQKRAEKLAGKLSTDDMLALYGLYKQATNGDVEGKRPGMLDVKGRAKYDAWAKCKGMPVDKARAAYVEMIEELSG